MWSYTNAHFQNFKAAIALQPNHHEDAQGKAERIGRCLHRAYYPGEYDPYNLLLAGSYGKGTAIRPTSDVDLMYFLPYDEYVRFSAYQGNGQSALLAEVRMKLLETFRTTDIRADGQVVVVDYESYKFEVVPAFLIGNQTYIADTNDGGRWKAVYPFQEISNLDGLDRQTIGYVRSLVQYMKVWKRVQDVPLKSIILENAAMILLRDWYFLDGSINAASPMGNAFYHDFLVRDFFGLLLRNDRLMLPDGEVILFGDGWRRKTEYAFEQATIATEYEKQDQRFMAVSHWQNIFGAQFTGLPQVSRPVTASAGLMGV